MKTLIVFSVGTIALMLSLAPVNAANIRFMSQEELRSDAHVVFVKAGSLKITKEPSVSGKVDIDTYRDYALPDIPHGQRYYVGP